MASYLEYRNTLDYIINEMKNSEPITPTMELVKLNLEAAREGITIALCQEAPEVLVELNEYVLN